MRTTRYVRFQGLKTIVDGNSSQDLHAGMDVVMVVMVVAM